MRKGQRRLEEVNGSWTTEDGREGETAAHSSRQVAVTDSRQWEEGGGEWWTAVAEREREWRRKRDGRGGGEGGRWFSECTNT